MGYSLCISRASSPIQPEELRCLGDLREDAFHYQGLEIWFREGELEAKGLTPEQLPPLLSLAEQLGAKLTGDDGEVYPPGTQPTRGPLSLLQRLHHWWLKQTQPAPTDLPYQIGARFRDVISGQVVTVVGLEGGALPCLWIRYPDGRQQKRALAGNGLEPLGGPA